MNICEEMFIEHRPLNVDGFIPLHLEKQYIMTLARVHLAQKMVKYTYKLF